MLVCLGEIKRVEQDSYLGGGCYCGNQKSGKREKQSHKKSHSSRDNLTNQTFFREHSDKSNSDEKHLKIFFQEQSDKSIIDEKHLIVILEN